MIDFKEIPDGQTWELFARDFLQAGGFFIESPPNRGPDGGKDLLVTEEHKGLLHRFRFRWLVSCKHFAESGVSVGTSSPQHEHDILDRVQAFKADGFMGFYSTVPSSALNDRLAELRDGGHIKNYHLFDEQLISTDILKYGMSRIIMKYLPKAYEALRPVHSIIDELVPLHCDCCGKDLLHALYSEGKTSLVAEASELRDDGTRQIIEVYFACKGDCDRTMQQSVRAIHQTVTSWRDIHDLAMPNQFLRFVLSIIGRLNRGAETYSESSIEKLRTLIMALAQKVFREVTEEEKERLCELMQFEL